MIDVGTLLERLLGMEDESERDALLKTNQFLLTTNFFQVLKEKVLAMALEDGQEALRMSAVGLEAAKRSAEQEGVAYAWWARGNALLFLGRHDDCLAAYSTAISVFASLGRSEQVAQLQTNCMSPLMWTGRLAEAQAMGQNALKVLTGQGNTRPVANLLLTLAACARRQSNHAEALAQAEKAIGIFTQLNDPVQVARCQITQAVALEYLDRFQESEALLQSALNTLAEHEKWPDWARTALNLGILHARLADHPTALRWMEQSRQAFLKSGIEMDAAIVDLYRAQSFLDVNLLPEAEALSEGLVETFSRLKMPRQAARAALLLAEAHTRHGQSVQALQELNRARQVFRVQGDEIEMALIDIQRAALLQKVGRPGEASRLASEAAKVLDVRHHPLRHAETHVIIGACCEDMGMIEEAQVAYRVAWVAGSYSTGTTEPPAFLAYRIAYARGAIAEAAGDRALAQGEYGRAVDYLEQITKGVALDELRDSYLTDKRPVYEAAFKLALEEDRTADTFRYSELARAGALRNFLAGKRRFFSTSEQERQAARSTTPLSRELEALKARWAWRFSHLHRPIDLMAEADKEQAEPSSRPAQLRELADLEQELADAYRRQRLSDPRFAALEHGEILGLEEVRQALASNTALLVFDLVGNRWLAFVITCDSTDIVPLGPVSALRWGAAGLGHALEEVHLFDDPADLVMLEEDLLKDLQALYELVLAKPLARLRPEINQLLIVPCDFLHTLPLGALYDGRQHLLERYAFCYLPSASLLTALPADRDIKDDLLLIVGHSWKGQLPLAPEEAMAVTQTLASDSHYEPLLLLEEKATAAALRLAAEKAGLLHIATHGSFRDDAPLFSSLHLADGPLTVNEIYEMDLFRTALVTLSGCQTGLGQGRGGEILGLTNAFFFAGAPTVVVSRWRVDDQVTAKLMQDFYKTLSRGETVAEALRAAQLGTLVHWPHAYYWAAFATWGLGFAPVFRTNIAENQSKRHSIE